MKLAFSLLRGMFGLMDEAGADGAAAGGADVKQDAGKTEVVEQKSGKDILNGDAGKETNDKQEPEKKGEEQPAAVEPGSMQQYIDQYKTEAPALSIALEFLHGCGIKPSDPAFKLAEVDGDFSLIEAQLAALGKPGTEQMLAIIKQHKADYDAKVAEFEKATDNEMRTVMGEDFDTILEWARTNAEDEEKAIINSMIDAGGMYARAASLLLKSLWEGTDPTRAAKDPLRELTPKQPNSSGPITAQQFASESEALYKSLGPGFRESPQYKTLQSRRAAARAAGR